MNLDLLSKDKRKLKSSKITKQRLKGRASKSFGQKYHEIRTLVERKGVLEYPSNQQFE